jgi:DNA polymerase-3 subunit epsilon
MTRGQDDLTIDLIDYSVDSNNPKQGRTIPTDLIVLSASEADCLAHDRVLEEITKASKKTALWAESSNEKTA